MRVGTNPLRCLTLTVAGIVLVGCGSGGSSPTTGAQSSAAIGAGANISKAQAIAYAHTVNLGAADVPGAVVSSQERESAAPSSEGVRFAICAGAVNPNRRIVNVKSPTFKIGRGTEATQLKSSVEVMPSATLAARNFAAVRSARGHACLARLLPQVLGGTAARRARFGPATTSILADPLPSGEEALGVRVTTSLTGVVAGKETRVPVYLDIFEILAGPAEVSLAATSVSQPANSATERRLLSLLYGRAQAHKL
jgi:hypothetical protein